MEKMVRKQTSFKDDRYQEEFTLYLLEEALPEEKKEVLRKALMRNAIFTSARTLEIGEITVYKEGWYIQLRGCQVGFNVFVLDNDRFDPTGTVPYRVIRKPANSKLNKLYSAGLHFWEGDWNNI